MLTLARGGNYDQAVFREFDAYLARAPRPPFVKLDNEPFFSRHQLSVLLAHFLRHVLDGQTRNAPTFADLLGTPVDGASFQRLREAVHAWLEGEDGRAALAEAEALRAMLPDGCRHVGRGGAELANRFRSRMSVFVDNHARRLDDLRRRIDEAKQEDKFALADRFQRDTRRYLDQFLVDLFVRGGLIPTYSFPVDDVRLEVLSRAEQRGRERAFQARSDDLDLTRDAAYAIAEYAPGNEVVAGGRVWTSAGIARYSGEFEIERHYRLCRACNHPEIHDFGDEIPPSCSNCSETLHGPRATYLQPKGFVTSAAEPEGRDPGAARLRARAIDEARLVTSAPHGAFEESGLAGVTLAFLPAVPEPGSRATPGELFVVNRGPKGYGYWRCRRCEHAAPATGPRALQGEKAKHRNPRTGTECSGTVLSRPVHLGHRFATDVRQIRLGRPVPLPEDPGEGDDAREAFVRTLVEAVRLSAANLLEVDLRELHATWVMHGAAPDIVLYDAVSGGAGYARRIGEEIPARRLLDAVGGRLACDCAAACRKCLLDYTNQRHWDRLNRLPVLAWLDELLEAAGTGDALAALGAVPWPRPSLEGLKERLVGAAEVRLYGPRWLEPDSEAEPAARDLVVDLLRAGKRIEIGTMEVLPAYGSQPAELRRVLEHLMPWLRDGALRLHIAPRPPLVAGRFQPRLVADRVHIWLAGDGEVPLFARLLPGEIAELRPGAGDGGADIAAWLDRWQPVELPPLLARPEARFHAYKPGERRDLGHWFGPLRGGTVERLRIRDPYALNGERNRGSLARFLAELARIVGDWPPRIEIAFMHPEDLQGSDGLSPGQQVLLLKADLRALGQPAGWSWIQNRFAAGGRATCGSACNFDPLRWGIGVEV